MGLNVDGIWEHVGQISAIVDGFGKHYGPDLRPATVHVSFFNISNRRVIAKRGRRTPEGITIVILREGLKNNYNL